MPKAFSKEFRGDVIRVYRDTDASMAQVAKGFGISPSCLKRWLAIDDRKSASPSATGQAAGESDSLREANKRITLLEQEDLVLRRAAAYLSQAHLPGIDVLARPRAGRRRDPRRGDVRAKALFDAHLDYFEFVYRFQLDEARDAGESRAERTA